MQARPLHQRHYLWLATSLFAIGLAIRVGLALAAAAITKDAAQSYLPLARAWQQGLSTKAFAAGIPPLYPMVTGYLARVVGDVEVAGRVVSLAAGMLLLVFVFLLARRLAGRWTAVVALALVAFHPYLCQFAAEIGPDSLGAALLVGVVYGVCTYLQTLHFRYMLLVAGALAGLALTRPEGFAYAPLTLVVLLVWPVAADRENERQGEGGTGRHDAGRRSRECERGGAPPSTQRLGVAPETRSWQPAAGHLRSGRRRWRHVAALVLILAGLCVPRLISVHARTGVWALDTRQRTWTARMWNALTSGQANYGQWRIWSRGGLKAVAGTVEITAAGFGPAALIFGIYGLIVAGRSRRRRIALVVAVFALYTFSLILLGNRVQKRYLLGAAALWQVWAAIGIVLLFLRVKLALRKPDAPVRYLRSLPVAAGLVIACIQLPWAFQRLNVEYLADRRMGEWMAANLPAGARVMAMNPVPVWYAGAVKVELPIFKPSRLTQAGLASRAQQVRAELILVDATTTGWTWCPDVWQRLEKGQWPYGRILHRQSERRHTLYLLDVSQPQDPPVKRGRGRTGRHATVTATSAPAGPASATQQAQPRHHRKRHRPPAVSSQPAVSR